MSQMFYYVGTIFPKKMCIDIFQVSLVNTKIKNKSLKIHLRMLGLYFSIATCREPVPFWPIKPYLLKWLRSSILSTVTISYSKNKGMLWARLVAKSNRHNPMVIAIDTSLFPKITRQSALSHMEQHNGVWMEQRQPYS